MGVAAPTRRAARACAAWLTGLRPCREGCGSTARRAQERGCWPRSRSTNPPPRLDQVRRRDLAAEGGIALEGEHVPVQAPAKGKRPSRFLEGDRVALDAVGPGVRGIREGVSLPEGEPPVVEGERELAPVLLVDLLPLGELLTGEAGPIDPVEQGCLLVGRGQGGGRWRAAWAVRDGG